MGVNLEQTSEHLTVEERQIITETVKKASNELINTYRLTGRDNMSSVSTEQIVNNAVNNVDLAEIVKTAPILRI